MTTPPDRADAPPRPVPDGEGGESRLVYLLPVIGAPIGMGAAILASFAIAGWHMTHAAVVQVETAWRPGEPLAARVLVLDSRGEPVPGAEVEIAARRGDERAPLGTLRDAAGVGAAQGRFTVPAWPPGPARLELQIRAHEAFTEQVEVELVADRPVRRGTYTVSGSTKNWADDSEGQPEKLRIALRPVGRLVAGFENALIARITDAEGKPHRGPAEVALLDGEFGPHRAGAAGPAVIVRGDTDPQGLIRIDGLLSTDVVRFEVRALAPAPSATAADAAKDGKAAPKDSFEKAGAKPAAAGAGAKGGAEADAKAGPKDSEKADAKADPKDSTKPDPKDSTKPGDAKGETADAKGSAKPDAKGETADAKAGGEADAKAGEADAKAGEPDAKPAGPAPLGVRKFRMVSFAGAVSVDVQPLAAVVGDALQIKARGLRAKRPVFVDIHGPDGAWVDTLDPPIVGLEPPRDWSSAGLTPGHLQAEAYHFTNAPGESAGIARIHLAPAGASPDLAPLIARQRERLDLPRVEKDFDRALEEKYLGGLAKASVAADDLPLLRAWLIGTLPTEVHGTPAALDTLPREQAQVVEDRRTWAGRVRWLLLGGGGLFLAATMLVIVRHHRGAAERLAREMHGQGGASEVAQEIRRAQRAVLVRAIALVVTMALGLLLTVAVLEKLFWQA